MVKIDTMSSSRDSEACPGPRRSTRYWQATRRRRRRVKALPVLSFSPNHSFFTIFYDLLTTLDDLKPLSIIYKSYCVVLQWLSNVSASTYLACNIPVTDLSL